MPTPTANSDTTEWQLAKGFYFEFSENPFILSGPGVGVKRRTENYRIGYMQFGHDYGIAFSLSDLSVGKHVLDLSDRPYHCVLAKRCVMIFSLKPSGFDLNYDQPLCQRINNGYIEIWQSEPLQFDFSFTCHTSDGRNILMEGRVQER